MDKMFAFSFSGDLLAVNWHQRIRKPQFWLGMCAHIKKRQGQNQSNLYFQNSLSSFYSGKVRLAIQNLSHLSTHHFRQFSSLFSSWFMLRKPSLLVEAHSLVLGSLNALDLLCHLWSCLYKQARPVQHAAVWGQRTGNNKVRVLRWELPTPLATETLHGHAEIKSEGAGSLEGHNQKYSYRLGDSWGSGLWV